MRLKRLILILSLVAVLAAGAYWWFDRDSSLINPNPNYKIGQAIDSFNGVVVHYNGHVGNQTGRNRAPDGYNLGMKYQCVEFVKRYYYQHYHHKMPYSYGNAKDFFDRALAHGALNKKRGLRQYRNGGDMKPAVGDLLVMDGSKNNAYGHVAIISAVNEDHVEIVQQNPGPYAKSRESIRLIENNNNWTLNRSRILGWLRIP